MRYLYFETCGSDFGLRARRPKDTAKRSTNTAPGYFVICSSGRSISAKSKPNHHVITETSTFVLSPAEKLTARRRVESYLVRTIRCRYRWPSKPSTCTCSVFLRGEDDRSSGVDYIFVWRFHFVTIPRTREKIILTREKFAEKDVLMGNCPFERTE